MADSASSGSDAGGARAAPRGGRRAFVDSDDSEGGFGQLGLGASFGGRRKRRLGGDDDDILGVFADAPRGGAKGGGKRGRRGADGRRGAKSPLRQPMSFVRGTTLQPVDHRKPPEEAAETADDGRKGKASEDEDEIDPRFRLDAVADPGPVEHGPQPQAKNAMTDVQMENLYGKGFAMMRKMGFAGGGIGARNDGIANPIGVQVRRKNQGLQEEGEMVNQDLYGTDAARHGRQSVKDLLNITAPKKKPQRPEPSEGWKKDAKPKGPKVVYKTASEVVGEPQPMRIVDMRGPEVRIASSFSELASSMAASDVKSLKELRHNTRLLVAKYEDRIREIAAKKKRCQEILLTAARDLEMQKVTAGLSDAEVRSCRAVASELADLRERQDKGSLGLTELGKTLTRLRRERRKEFHALRAFDFAVALAVPLARKELASWRPLQKPQDGLKLLAPWRALTEGEDIVIVAKLCDEAVLPRLRGVLSEWSVRDFDPCIQLFDRCREVLPPDAVDAMVAQVVLPKLKVEVDNWDPRTDRMPIHLWVHPWLPSLGAKLNSLWAPIRFKLSACLELWNPRDKSAKGMLKPWVHVFDAANWEPLVEKVLSKLKAAMATPTVEVPFKAERPMVAAVKDLFEWVDLLPVASIARLLEMAFFPPWHAALQQWLRTDDCDFGEVLEWYQGWRALLPAVVVDQGTVQKQLAKGLEVMKSLMEAKLGGAAAPSEPTAEAKPRPAPEAAPDDGASESAASSRRQGHVLPEDINFTASDLLAETAAEHGLLFRPKAGRVQHGHQVYQFGGASVYVDKDVVYAAPRAAASAASEEWQPVTFDEVLKQALAARRR